MTDTDSGHAESWSYLKLAGHIAQKGWQLGSAIAVPAGLATLYLKGYEEPGLTEGARNAGYSGVAGIGFAGMSYFVML